MSAKMYQVVLQGRYVIFKVIYRIIEVKIKYNKKRGGGHRNSNT